MTALGYDKLGQTASGKKWWSDDAAVAGQQFEYVFDDIGNRRKTGSGGNNSGANLHYANYRPNWLNEYISREVPGAVQSIGTANSSATVTLWSGNWRVDHLYTMASRKGTYYWGELLPNNSTGAMWLTITNLAVVQNGTSPDIVTNTVGNAFLPQTLEYFYYDVDGNLTTDGRWTYTWDAENRLAGMQALSTIPAGAQLKLSFTYDSQGRRIQKKVYTWNSGSWILASDSRFAYDGWNLLAILNPQSSILQSFVWGLDLSGSPEGAGGVGGLLAVSDAVQGAHFAAYDANGNVAALVEAADGTVSAQYEYGPFAEVLRATGPMARTNPLRFSSKYQDDEAELIYYGHRYYSRSTGRWCSRDNIGERGGRNLYCFVMNAPVSAVDVLGAEMYSVCDNACADFKRSEEREGRTVPNGAIVCCLGLKFICTWGADNEKNQRAKEIARKCLEAHERIHLPNTECTKCTLVPVASKWTKEGKAACQEEVDAYTAGRDCFEKAKSECSGDPDCIKSIEGWITHEEEMRKTWEALCKRFDWPKR